MNSRIYKGWVRHRRVAPTRHQFRYRLFMLYLDLAELPQLFDRTPFWSARRRALAWFKRSDYLGASDVPLDRAVRDLVQVRTGARPGGPIRLLTHLRYFGYCMNPVSFYYCFDACGERLETIVAEITNTPWKERHQYVLTVEEAGGAEPARIKRFGFDKVFHVSPFMPMDVRNIGGTSTNRANGCSCTCRTAATAPGCSMPRCSLLEEHPLSPRSLLAVLAGFPLMTTADHRRHPLAGAAAVAQAHAGPRSSTRRAAENPLKPSLIPPNAAADSQETVSALTRLAAAAAVHAVAQDTPRAPAPGGLRRSDECFGGVTADYAARRHHPRAQSEFLFGCGVRGHRRRRRGVHQRLLALRRSHRAGAPHGGPTATP